MAATTTAGEAHQQFTGHRFYRYRGCAPDPDQPTQAAGDPNLSWRAWEAPDVDGGEDQAARLRREAAAKAVCRRCPVQQACLTYGTSTNPEGRIAVEHGILGGATMLERHRMFIRQRQATLDEEQAAAADRRLRTAQKLAVLRALAAHTDPYEVARAAGVDVRTANWQRSACCTLLGLDKLKATRSELLAAARDRGLLTDVTIAPGDKDVPAVPPPGTTPIAAIGPATAAAVPAPRQAPTGTDPAHDDVPPARGPRIPAPHRGRFHAIDGQLSLDQALLEHRHLRLVPTHPSLLGAAA